jgi:hypothetical protein
MAQELQPIMFQDFKGMDEELSPDQLGSSMLRYLENLLCTNGRLSVRPGSAKYNGTEIAGGAAIRGLATYYRKKTVGYETQVVCVSGGDLWYSEALTASPFASCGASLSGTNRFSFAVIDNYLYAGDGVNPLQRWDGASLVEVEGIAKPVSSPTLSQVANAIHTCESASQFSATGAGLAVALDNTWHHAGSGSIKMTGTITTCLNSYVQLDLTSGGVKDLSGSRYVGFWARANLAGTYIRFGFGEAAGNESEAAVVIDKANTWQYVAINIEELPQTSRDAVRYFRWTVENADAGFEFWVDQLQYGGGLTGEFLYRYSWYNTNSDVESGPSDDEMVTVSGDRLNSILVGWSPGAAPADVTHVRIYRTGGYSAVWRLVVQTAVGSGSYKDQLSVDQLGDEQLVGGTAPPCAFLASWRNRLCYAGDPDNPSRLYISNYEEPQQVPPITLLDAIESAGGFLDIDPADGDKISGLAAFGDILVIFKHHSVHALQGTSFQNFRRVRLTDALGCASHWSIAAVASTLIWYTGEDVIAWSQGGPMTVISNPVRNRVRGLDTNSKAQVAGIVHDMKYLLAYQAGGMLHVPEWVPVNDEVLVYDLRTEGWSVFKGWGVSCWATLGGADNDLDLYGGAVGDGFVWQYMVGLTDGSSAISWQAEFPAIHLSALSSVKMVKEYGLLVTPAVAALAVSIMADGRAASDVKTHSLTDGRPATSTRDQYEIISRPARSTNGQIIVFTLSGTTAVGTEVHRFHVQPEVVRRTG